MFRKTSTTLALILFLFGAAANRTPGAQKDDAKAPDKLLEGVWEMVSLVRNGKEVEPVKEGKHLSSFQGNTFTARIGDKVIGKATLKIDATQTPRTIDFSPLEGPNKGKTALGIYEVKGDELRICHADPDKERPTEFASKEGSGHSLRTYKRHKP